MVKLLSKTVFFFGEPLSNIFVVFEAEREPKKCVRPNALAVDEHCVPISIFVR